METDVSKAGPPAAGGNPLGEGFGIRLLFGAVFVLILLGALHLAWSFHSETSAGDPLAQPELADQGLPLMRQSDCLTCHLLEGKLLGPSFREIAARYSPDGAVLETLVGKVREGGSGVWGAVPMTPHATLVDADAEKMVAWILTRSPTEEAAAALAGGAAVSGTVAAVGAETEYRRFPIIGSRVAVWVVAQLHLLFAAFVLAVPMFALIIQLIGFKARDQRYDRLAYEFIRLLSVSFSFTAALGAVLTFLLIVLYPKFMNYMSAIFGWTYLPYALLFFAEAFFLYCYYYGWGKFSPRKHVMAGIGLNVVGIGIIFVADSWLTFMTSPAGVTDTGELIDVFAAINNFTWMPINIHRLIANISFGGSIAAAYGAFRFLQAKSDEERAHCDWMGYVGNFVAISAFLPLSFAGYWLGKEIYAYSQNLGMTLMGGAFSWLFIIQAILIGMLFLAANYYLWLGMERIQGAERFRKYIKYLLASVTICFIVWAAPHSLVASMEEARKMGGSHHPMLGVLGVMSAKNTAVNILILTTFLSFLLYRRGNKVPTVSWAKAGNSAQFGIFVVATLFVIFLGVYGYFVEAKVRIALSVPQVLAVLIAMLLVTVIDVLMFRNARLTGSINWGKMPVRAQYTLVFIAVSFTWLMGLMGYVRSGLRQHWHVYGIIRDTSVDAFTPTLGFATKVVSVTVLIFFVFIGLIFYLTSLQSRRPYSPSADSRPEEVGP